jgi:cytochrome c oxidase subunit 3
MEAAVSDIVPFKPKKSRRDVTSYVGMIIFLGGWAMMFAALFFAYAIVRYKQVEWPPAGENALPLVVPAINTALLVASSAALMLALRAVRGARPAGLKLWLCVSFVLACGFLASQIVVWRGLWLDGLKPSSGIYGSVFYGLTWFHALHVIVGLVGLLTLLPRAFAGRFSVGNHTAVRIWSMYWHFVDVVWVLMFMTIYVL